MKSKVLLLIPASTVKSVLSCNPPRAEARLILTLEENDSPVNPHKNGEFLPGGKEIAACFLGFKRRQPVYLALQVFPKLFCLVSKVIPAFPVVLVLNRTEFLRYSYP